MFIIIRFIILFVFLTSATHIQASEQKFQNNKDVNAFIDKMVEKHQFNKTYLTQIFEKTGYMDRALNLIQKPAEDMDWGSYMTKVITDIRTADGIKYYKSKRSVLMKAQKKYGVPSYIIAGIIGIESNFGQIPMRYRAVDTLATLGFFFPRRSAFFLGELEALLVLARKEKTDPFSYMGSYAGAIGIPQFMPGNVAAFAVDGNGDGKIDIINSHDDAIFSVANYLKKHGWKQGQPVSVKVQIKGTKYKKYLQEKICTNLKYKVSTLKNVGIRFPINVRNDLKVALFPVDAGNGKTEYHVAFNNFCVIAKYNNNTRYVLAVNYLSQRIGKRAGAKR